MACPKNGGPRYKQLIWVYFVGWTDSSLGTKREETLMLRIEKRKRTSDLVMCCGHTPPEGNPRTNPSLQEWFCNPFGLGTQRRTLCGWKWCLRHVVFTTQLQGNNKRPIDEPLWNFLRLGVAAKSIFILHTHSDQPLAGHCCHKQTPDWGHSKSELPKVRN